MHTFGNNIAQPIGHRPPKPFEQRMKHLPRRHIGAQKIPRRLVRNNQRAISGKFHQCNRHMFKICQHRLALGAGRHRHQIDLTPLARALNFCQDGPHRPGACVNLNLLAGMHGLFVKDLIKPFRSGPQQAAHRFIREQHNTGLVADKHWQA